MKTASALVLALIVALGCNLQLRARRERGLRGLAQL